MRSVLAGACGLPVVLLAAGPATASMAWTSAAGPQHSATANVTAEIGYASELVRPGGQDTMTVSLINHGPQSLDDHTSVHVTVTTPQHTEVSPTVLETIRGNAPTGSRNAVPATRSVPLTQVFVRSAPGFFDVVVPAGSFGNSASFRSYTFTLHVSPNVSSGAQLVGGGVAVALENYVGLTVAKSVVPPPPKVVTPPARPRPSRKPRSVHTAGTSERIQAAGPAGCPMGGTPGVMPGGSSWPGGTRGPWQCMCSVDRHMSAASGGRNGTNGAGAMPCRVPTLAATGVDSAYPLALGLLALAAGVTLMGLSGARKAGQIGPDHTLTGHNGLDHSSR